MKVHVTGVAGFLGNHIARALIREGHEVGGSDNLITGSRANLDGIDMGNEAIRDVRIMDAPEADIVVHAAAIPRSTWPNEDDLWEHNFHATMAVLRWGMPVIYISSSTAANPTNVYGRTKQVAERVVLMDRGNLALRPCNIYGPGQSEDDGVTTPNVLAAFRRQRATTGTVRVEGDGTKTRHWVHVSDVARAVVLAVESDVRGWWLDICGERASIGEVAAAFGCPIGYLPNRPNDPQDIPQSGLGALRQLGWKPLVSLAEGLADVTRP